MANMIKKQADNQGGNIDIDSIAEQWVKLLLTQIETNTQQKVNGLADKNKSQNTHE